MEHVPVSNSVYEYLKRAETKGLLPHFSTTSLPLQRMAIVDALKMIRKSSSVLSKTELNILESYESEFGISGNKYAVLIYSATDSLQAIPGELFSDKEKFVYRQSDSVASIYIEPLGSADYRKFENGTNGDVFIGTLGTRIFGTIGNNVGFYLQATNGSVLSGDRELALRDPKYQQNIKLRRLNSDIDFSESHVVFNLDWFYASIGRETRQLGSGLFQRIFINNLAPPFDAVSLGAKFKTFEYSFIHGSLLSLPITLQDVGADSELPSKYIAMHRFAIKPSWGEIAFWENVVYTGRGVDFAYINPLSFFKSLEHALHDRDNTMMGLDATIRPFNGLQLKGTFLLDDIKFSTISEGDWSNKTAWNIAAIAALPGDFDAGIEYTRVEPYTFSHFNYQNSMTNDSVLLGSNILPNSDRINAMLRWWWGDRYPLELSFQFTRHGDNIYNENDSLVVNVGGSPRYAKRYEDPATVVFLDGILETISSVKLKGGIEVFRQWNIIASYEYKIINGNPENQVILLVRFGEF